MTFPKPADGLDGKSVTNVKIDTNNHLICTLDDGTDIDAGEIKGIGGGLVQEARKTQFPPKGKEDTLYLSKDTEQLFYWNGTDYKPITSDESQILAELKTASIEFDNISDTFDLPVDDVAVNVYINGMYMTEGFDYTIDRTVQPNQIIFDTIYEDYEICTITYLKPVSGGSGDGECTCPEIVYAENADIDKWFDNDSVDPDNSSNIDFATKTDIDNLFK